MNTVVVYKTPPESVNVIINVLRKEGFNPIAMDDPSPLVRRRAAGVDLVNIVVPREEADGAILLLRKWDQSQQPEISKTTETLVKPFWISTIFTVILAGIFLLFGILPGMTPVLFIIWLVVFALLANLDGIFKKLRKNDK